MESPDQSAPGLPSEAVVLPARGWRIDPGHALLASAVCWAGFALVVVAVLGGRSAELDAGGLRLFRTGIDLHPRGAPWLTEAVRDYTALGGVLLRNLIAIAALVALLFLRLRREAMLLALTIVSGWAVNSAVKTLVGRPRPDLQTERARYTLGALLPASFGPEHLGMK